MIEGPWDESTVTWNNAPGYRLDGVPTYIKHTDFIHNIDITEMARAWNQNTLPNFGVRITTLSPPILTLYAANEFGAGARLVVSCDTQAPTLTPLKRSHKHRADSAIKATPYTGVKVSYPWGNKNLK